MYGFKKRQIKWLTFGMFLYFIIIVCQYSNYGTITRKRKSYELTIACERKPKPEDPTIIARKPKSKDLLTIARKPNIEKLSNKFSAKMPKEDVFANRPRPWYMTGGTRRPVSPSEDQQPKLFPENLPGSDRIIEQLMYTLPKNEENRTMKTILLANGFIEWRDVAGGQTEFTDPRCPVDRCSITDRAEASAAADAVIFVLHPMAFEPSHYQFNVKRPSKQVWIYYSLENPYLTRFNDIHMRRNMFNWTATYRRDSDIVTPYQRWVHYDAPLDSSRFADKNYAANKTKKVAVLISNCKSFNSRLQFIHELAVYIEVDIFGKCGKYECHSWDNCMKHIRQYKFYLSFENANCRDYITEKLFVNGLQQDVLPIVMGARPQEYAAVAPHRSYLHVDEFRSIRELAVYLHTLDQDDELYNSYFKWKGTGEFINTFFFCRLCAMLHASDLSNRRAHYLDVGSWMHKAACMPRT